jgi:flagellar hook-associated protein 2
MSSSLENALGISSDSNFTTVSTDETYHNNNISGIALQTITVTNTLTKDTKLADLGVTSGEYCVYNNGVKYTGVLSSEDTVEDFLDTIKQFGLNGRIISDGDESKLYLVGNGDTYLTTSGFNSSNISTQLFGTDNSQNVKKENYSATLQTSSTQTSTTKADETTLLSTYDKPWGNSTLTSEGSVVFNLDGVQKVIQVSEDETIGSLLEKFRDNGVQASITDGQILLEGGFSSFSIDTSASTSNVINNLGLAYKDNLGGYSSSSSVCEQTITTVKEEMLSVAANADLSTTLDTLNITSGSLSIYRNGSKAIINIDENQTFSDLKSKLSQTFGSVDLTIEDGYLKIYDKDGAALEIGSNTDTSNFSSVLGLTKSDASTLATTRRIYQVNDSTKLTSNGVFRNGTITAGTFTIGDETLTITDDTTIRDLVSMINSSENTAATAYWDSINGQLVLTSRNTGASYINIESGTSNLTDILGFTDSSAGTKKINTSNQTLGDNAKFSINGTNYTSNSNKITSDISRIKGVTLNLNDITEGESVTISVERDTETLANTMSEIVTAYNELITKVDTEISSTGALSDQSMLKLLRNRLKSLMTSSESGSLVFKNLDAIGICSSQATASSISTDGTYTLTFDKDKFLEAYSTDRDSLKTLLLGGDSNTGVFTKIEELLESALEGAGGYFETANSTYTKRISALESKITKANTAVSNYQTQLEKKFQYMDMLIGNYQQQYSSFLSS